MSDKYVVEREKLNELKALFEKAVENNSIEDMRAHTHPDFSFVSFTDKTFQDFDSFKKQWNITRKEMVGSGSFSTSLDPQPTLFFDDIAIASGSADNKLVNNKGQAFNFHNNWTTIFKRDNNGEWKVLRAHNSLDPFGNPMLVQGVKDKVFKLSILSFLIGFILCALLALLFLK